MLLPGFAVVLAVIVAVQFSAPSLALDRDSMKVIDKALSDDTLAVSEDAGETAAARPKINHSASANAKGKASGSASAASAGPSAASTYIPMSTKKRYKDGAYTASSRGFAGPIKVKVTIRKGKIKSVKILSSRDNHPYIDKARRLLRIIVKRQSPNVDAVSGATYSSNGIRNAVKKALKKAQVRSKKSKKKKSGKNKDKNKNKNKDKDKKKDDKGGSTVSDTKYENGTWSGSATGYVDNRSGIKCTTNVIVTVENNKIAKIQVRSEDPTQSGDDSYWKQAYPKIPNDIIKKNDPDVDAVSGATMSSNGIMNAVRNALKGHELKDSSESGITTDKNQTSAPDTKTDDSHGMTPDTKTDDSQGMTPDTKTDDGQSTTSETDNGQGTQGTLPATQTEIKKAAVIPEKVDMGLEPGNGSGHSGGTE
ncbi:MAG: FMN-binding protein [Anaerovoracaceae bacterium]